MPTYPRKRHPADRINARQEPAPHWINVRALARVHASSEDPPYTIQQAFTTSGRGWRAAASGVQVVEVHFREPHDLTRIRLVFDDDREERTQQFTISWSGGRGERHGEVVRQQFNFSPRGAIREVEEYKVALKGVETLSIHITPDLSGRSVRASLTTCQVA
jgi:hypothetical protein